MIPIFNVQKYKLNIITTKFSSTKTIDFFKIKKSRLIISVALLILYSSMSLVIKNFVNEPFWTKYWFKLFKINIYKFKKIVWLANIFNLTIVVLLQTKMWYIKDSYKIKVS